MTPPEDHDAGERPRTPVWNEGSSAVGRFYDEHADAFMRVYGNVIQALRTRDVATVLDIEGSSMGLAPGMRVLDAGCGVCGPAMHFARQFGVTVDGVTASDVQVGLATQHLRESGLADRVTVQHGDFHHLDALLPAGAYDVVCFLESFGHSSDKGTALSSAWAMLKPGGSLYIKDLFIKEAAIEAHRPAIAQGIREINDAYRYNVGDLCDVLRLMRQQGFILTALRTMDIPLDDFEDLSISHEFGQLTGIHRIDDLSTYIFPVDFFEIICRKPWYGLDQGSNRYFLQNLYELQVRGTPMREL